MTKVKPLSTFQLIEATFNCIPELNFLSPSNLSYHYSKFMKTNSMVIRTNQLITLLLGKLFQYIPAPPTVSLILHYSWISSHLLTIIGTVLYSFNLFGNTSIPPVHDFQLDYQINWLICWYALSVSGSMLAYALVLYHHYLIILNSSGSNELLNDNDNDQQDQNEKEITLIKILNSENTPLLGISILTLFTPINITKLFPSTIYSLLNISSYILIELYPKTKLFELTFPLFVIVENKLLLMAAILELFNFFIYLTHSLFNKTHSYSTILYLMLICLKIQNSYYSCLAIKYVFQFFTYLSKWINISPGSNSNVNEPIVADPRAKDDDDDSRSDPEDDLNNDIEINDISTFEGFSLPVLKRSDRITSFMFDNLSVINDL
ncbi:hypothetical protein DFJ63DRAFT_332421 [Scheffersomyces coipomensis]|uniref:uncharacterized protein n=1 Tax=Scheffersomyces coipomensis TaxID=1788519 RepID=UPI00315DCB07